MYCPNPLHFRLRLLDYQKWLVSNLIMLTSDREQERDSQMTGTGFGNQSRC